MSREMTRKELAQQVFGYLKMILPYKDSIRIWIAIAETDDDTLLQEYHKLATKNYSLREWKMLKDEEEQEKKK